MTPPARQQPCSAADARTRLAHARKFLEVAELVAGLCAIALMASLSSVAAADGAHVRDRHHGVRHAHVHGATPQTGERVKAVAGSSRFLVYIKYAVTNGRHATTARLYERTAQGAQRKLGVVPFNNVYSLAGRYLSDPGIQVWNLKTGQEHHRTAPPRTDWIAAAPHGYTVAKLPPRGAGVRGLETVSMAGKVRSLGDPFPHAAYAVAVNTHRYVAYAPYGQGRPWGARTATFAHPHHLTTLIGNSGPTSTPDTYCGIPNRNYVACDTDSHRYRLQMYDLGGKLVAHTGNYDGLYGAAPAVLAGSTYWLTQAPQQRLRQLTTAGQLTQSKRRFATSGPVRAFHRIIVGAPGKTALLAVTSARSAPVVLVAPKGS